VNRLTIRINTEDEWLNAFVMNPGQVQTYLGNTGARGVGLKKAPLGVDESCDRTVEVCHIYQAEARGNLISYDGAIYGW